MQVIDNIPVWGSPVDEGALTQIKNCARTADKVAMMADHHKGYAVPIGGVVAYRDAISSSGVGYDIAWPQVYRATSAALWTRCSASSASAWARLETLAGKTIALLDISKPGGDVFLDRLAALLTQHYGVARVARFKKPTFAKPAPAGVMEALLADHPDAVIEGLAD